MSTAEKNKVDYVVISTGYTSRILRADLAKVFIDQSCDYCHDPTTNKLVDENGMEPPTNTKEVLDLQKCVYVKDDLWGPRTDTKTFKTDASGIFPIAPLCEVEEARSLIDLTFKDRAEKFGGDLDGYIVFKDTDLIGAFKLVDFLMEVDYCACFHLSCMDDVDLRRVAGKTLLWLDFDCESG